MKFRHYETPGSSDPDEVTLGLYERYDVDDDLIFEIPDDELDAATQRRLEEAGHKPIPEDDDQEVTGEEEADSDDAAPADETADDEAEAEIDDEYADLDRSELYELYKDRGGPLSWNETTAGDLRDALRVHDEHNTFPTADES